jgi:hypothetical protein
LLLFYIKAQEVEGKEEERKRRSTNDIYSSISFHISVAMCLILLAHQVVPDLPLLVLANRDEFIDRIVEPLQVWSNNHGENNNSEDLVAGMDRWKGNDNGNTYHPLHPTVTKSPMAIRMRAAAREEPPPRRALAAAAAARQVPHPAIRAVGWWWTFVRTMRNPSPRIMRMF